MGESEKERESVRERVRKRDSEWEKLQSKSESMRCWSDVTDGGMLRYSGKPNLMNASSYGIGAD